VFLFFNGFACYKYNDREMRLQQCIFLLFRQITVNHDGILEMQLVFFKLSDFFDEMKKAS